MNPDRETVLRFRAATATFRIRGSTPQMLIEHGCDEGAARIYGRNELEAIAAHIQLLLARVEKEA